MGGGWFVISNNTSGSTMFHVFPNNYPTVLYLYPAVVPMCVWHPTYIDMERAWGWGRRHRLSQRYVFLSTSWYDMYDVLYLVCLCSGAEGEEGFLRTKQRRTPDHKCISIWMLPIKSSGWKTPPGNAWCRIWFSVRVCETWWINRNVNDCTRTNDFLHQNVISGTLCIIWLLLCCCCLCP